MKRRKCMADGGILAGVTPGRESASGRAGGGFARGGILPVLGIGSGTSDSIPVVLAGHKVHVSNGEGVAVLPKKTMDTPGAVAAVEDVIEQTNGKPPAPMADGGKYAAGALPEEEKTGSRFLSGLPEGGILRTQQGRQQVAQSIANAPAIGAPLTIGGAQKPVTAQQMYSSSPPANDFQQRLIEGQGLRPDAGLLGPRAGSQSFMMMRQPEMATAPASAATRPAQQQIATGYSNEGRPPAIQAANVAPPSTPAPAAVGPQAKFPQPGDHVPSGTGFVRNNRTGAVTPVGSPSIASPAPQSVATPMSTGVMQAIQPAAEPTDTSRYRQAAEKILLDESRGPGGGVAARLLMGLAGRAAGMDNDAARTANETAAVAARAHQAAAELASIDSYRRASLGIQGREQSVREQESADKLQDTAAQRAARAGIADAIESGDEAKIKKAQAKGIAAGVLKQPDVQKRNLDPYRMEIDRTTGEQWRINEETGATDRFDRATNTWQPVGVGRSGASPYPEGTMLQGKDGKLYVVRNGAPVLEGK